MSLANLINDGSFAVRPLSPREARQAAALAAYEAAKAEADRMRRAYNAAVRATQEAAKVEEAALADYDAALREQVRAKAAAQEAGVA